MSKILEKLELTFGEINSENKEVRRKARKKLAESYPDLKCVAEVTNEKKRTFPTTVNGFQSYYPINNMLSCSTVYNSANESAFRILGFKGEENARAVVKSTKLSDLAKKSDNALIVTPISTEKGEEMPEKGEEFAEVIENVAENTEETPENGAEIVTEKPKKTRKI